MDFSIFFDEQNRLLNRISLDFKRSFYNYLNIENSRMVALLGQRGVGKTTLILQYIKENFLNSEKALYFSVDNPYFQTISLYEFAKEFEQYGGEILLIDEIHKYKDFASHLKAIYDSTNLKVIISGSSLLQIYKKYTDLSRRIIVLYLPNLSFREYLELNNILKIKNFSLDDIISNHIEISNDIIKSIRPLKYFKEYIEFGAYPFIIEGKSTYKSKLINIINHIIEVDLPYVNSINYGNIDKIKKLLYLIATSVPFTPNISDISQKTGVSRPIILEYLHHLENSHLIINLHYQSRGYAKLTKPDKIYLNNTNLMRAITYNSNLGNERETFFINQFYNYYLNQHSFYNEHIFLTKKGDFLIDQYTFEIGGKSKTAKQIKNIENSYIIADNIETGFKRKIPLYLFGFLY